MSDELERRIAVSLDQRALPPGRHEQLMEDLARALQRTTEVAAAARPGGPSERPEPEVEVEEDLPQMFQRHRSVDMQAAYQPIIKPVEANWFSTLSGMIASAPGTLLVGGIAVAAILAAASPKVFEVRTAEVPDAVLETMQASTDVVSAIVLPDFDLPKVQGPALIKALSYNGVAAVLESNVAEDALIAATLVEPDDAVRPAVKEISDRARSARFLRLIGTQLVASGEIGRARDVLGDASALEDAAATFALAETYDPNMLAAWNAQGVDADVVMAKTLYERALQAGEGRAKLRIEALKVK